MKFRVFNDRDLVSITDSYSMSYIMDVYAKCVDYNNTNKKLLEYLRHN
jgi:hypothetical protein